MHKDFDSKNVETVNYAEFCPGTCRRRAAQKMGVGQSPEVKTSEPIGLFGIFDPKIQSQFAFQGL
jgi:hypothetical protein